MIEYIPLWLLRWLANDAVVTYSRAFLLLVLGIPFSYYSAKRFQQVISLRYTPQHGHIVGQLLRYGGSILFITAAINQLGFSLAPLLGAAGVLGVAIGFASQTSASNIISGLFLLVEEPFTINDVISVSDTTGQVLSIDLLSVKIRSFDNKFVRIPHETILKSKVVNLTRFPIRRVDIDIPVSNSENIDSVKEVILKVVDENISVLKLPEPLIYFKGFGSSFMELILFVWAEKDEWFSVKNQLPQDIKAAFDEAGIVIPVSKLELSTSHPGRQIQFPASEASVP
jgi:small-conductance mechanosensitive channel